MGKRALFSFSLVLSGCVLGVVVGVCVVSAYVCGGMVCDCGVLWGCEGGMCAVCVVCVCGMCGVCV